MDLVSSVYQSFTFTLPVSGIFSPFNFCICPLTFFRLVSPNPLTFPFKLISPVLAAWLFYWCIQFIYITVRYYVDAYRITRRFFPDHPEKHENRKQSDQHKGYSGCKHRSRQAYQCSLVSRRAIICLWTSADLGFVIRFDTQQSMRSFEIWGAYVLR